MHLPSTGPWDVGSFGFEALLSGDGGTRFEWAIDVIIDGAE